MNTINSTYFGSCVTFNVRMSNDIIMMVSVFHITLSIWFYAIFIFDTFFSAQLKDHIS
jgi:hypothetical protein